MKSKSISFFRREFDVVAFRPINFFNQALVSLKEIGNFEEKIICILSISTVD